MHQKQKNLFSETEKSEKRTCMWLIIEWNEYHQQRCKKWSCLWKDKLALSILFWGCRGHFNEYRIHDRDQRSNADWHLTIKKTYWVAVKTAKLCSCNASISHRSRSALSHVILIKISQTRFTTRNHIRNSNFLSNHLVFSALISLISRNSSGIQPSEESHASEFCFSKNERIKITISSLFETISWNWEWLISAVLLHSPQV